jgi:hypothetical protein
MGTLDQAGDFFGVEQGEFGSNYWSGALSGTFGKPYQLSYTVMVKADVALPAGTRHQTH